MPHDAYFQGNPTRLDVSRSRFSARPRWTGSWNVGKLFPIFATSSVMPGDTFKMSLASAIRMVRPLFPVMDDMEITIEAYFVPHRLTMSRKTMSPDLSDSNHSWSAFIGAQDSLLNMPTPGDVKLPVLVINPANYVVGSVGDCLGYHNASSGYYVNPLKVLAFYMIWNEYFREPNTQSPVTYSVVSSSSAPTGAYISLVGTDAYISASNDPCEISLPPVSRYHGYFGSALPWPQRNSTQVELPLGDTAPVGSLATTHDFGTAAVSVRGVGAGAGVIPDGEFLGVDQGKLGGSEYHGSDSDILNTVANFDDNRRFNNLWADLSAATAASINEFRLAVQTQRWFEALARSGNKYSDLVHGMFGVRGVSIPDRPEYLGGFTAPINMSQVAATSGDASTGALGDTGAFSLSNPSGYLFTKSFTEHGTIMVVACCRVRESFSQGIDREDTRFDRFDFYWPQFANLGEQPILKKELYIDGTHDDEVFGYQEAWAEYRMFTDKVVGYLNPTANAAIAGYTYANYFASAPTLKGYLDASTQKANVDRTLTATSSATGFQMFGQFEFQIEMVRPMPTYSIPGLVDHH